MKTIRSKQFIRFLTLVSAVITVMLAVFTEAYSQRTTQERHVLTTYRFNACDLLTNY